MSRCDRLSRIFGIVFAVAALLANVYGWYRDRVGEQVAALLYAGGGLAVVFAGDLLSMLVAWESHGGGSSAISGVRRRRRGSVRGRASAI